MVTNRDTRLLKLLMLLSLSVHFYFLASVQFQKQSIPKLILKDIISLKLSPKKVEAQPKVVATPEVLETPETKPLKEVALDQIVEKPEILPPKTITKKVISKPAPVTPPAPPSSKIKRVTQRKTIARKSTPRKKVSTVRRVSKPRISRAQTSKKTTKKTLRKVKFELLNTKFSKPVYPREAIRRQMEGEVLLALKINQKGEMMSSKILKSSGHKLLDRSALLAAKDWGFKKFRSSKPYLTLTKKVVFKLQ